MAHRTLIISPMFKPLTVFPCVGICVEMCVSLNMNIFGPILDHIISYQNEYHQCVAAQSTTTTKKLRTHFNWNSVACNSFRTKSNETTTTTHISSQLTTKLIRINYFGCWREKWPNEKRKCVPPRSKGRSKTDAQSAQCGAKSIENIVCCHCTRRSKVTLWLIEFQCSCFETCSMNSFLVDAMTSASFLYETSTVWKYSSEPIENGTGKKNTYTQWLQTENGI